MRRFRKPVGRLLVVLCALTLVAAACGNDKNKSAPTGGAKIKEGGTITYAQEQEPTGFNNLTSKDNLLELRHIMRHLWPYAYRARPDFSVEPTPMLDGPAKVVSQSPFVVEWKIAKDAVWSDGVAVTADDLEWVYLNCNGSDKNADCASTSGYDQIVKFEKPDSKTARATFKEPYVEYEGLFGDPIPPAHIGKTLPGGWNTGFDADPKASAGPYQLKEWKKGDHFTLERNPKWWGPKPHLDTIIFREIPDPATHPDALKNNEVQLIYPQPQVDLVQNVKAIPNVTSEVNFGPTWEHLDFNFKNPLLADKAVRQAIAYGIDRNKLVGTLMKPFNASAQRLDSRVYVSNQPQYKAGGTQFQTPDPVKAAAALTAAGYTKGPGGIFQKAGKKLSFRIRVKDPNPLRDQSEQLIQADLKAVGIDIKIDNFQAPQSIGTVGSKGDFDLFIFAWVGTPFPVSGAQQVFDSASSSNFGKYANPQVDALVKKASVELDKTKRADLLNQADALMWDDLPNLPLFQKPAGLLAYSNNYANIKDNTTSEGLFWNSETWGIKSSATQ